MAAITPSCITAARIRELFNYDPVTGVFSRRVNTVRGRAGQVITANTLCVDGEYHKTVRYIWLHYYGEWPKGLVDHKNRIKSHAYISNLRDVTHTQNQQNKVSPNPHGYKGVTWRDRKKNPWIAKIRVDGARINLGSFPTKEAAAEAYEAACLKYHGEFAQLGVS
jgi:hypothetical protein